MSNTNSSIDLGSKSGISSQIITHSLVITSEKPIYSANYMSWATFFKLWFLGQRYEDHLTKKVDDIPIVE